MDNEQRLTSIEHQLSSHDQRIQSLERMVSEAKTDRAVRMERDKHLDRRFDKLERDVGDVKGYLLKIVWLIVAGIVAAFMAFMVNGGLGLGS
tara:strand:+ start:1394 stop:1669 length:276 start_codon:yes stop_codon:yes gene_type:complete